MVDNSDFDFPIIFTEEEEEAINALQEAYDRVILLALQRQFNVKIEKIDDEHLKIDGVVYDNDEFNDWLDEQYALMFPYEDFKKPIYKA